MIQVPQVPQTDNSFAGGGRPPPMSRTPTGTQSQINNGGYYTNPVLNSNSQSDLMQGANVKQSNTVKRSLQKEKPATFSLKKNKFALDVLKQSSSQRQGLSNSVIENRPMNGQLYPNQLQPPAEQVPKQKVVTIVDKHGRSRQKLINVISMKDV